MSGVTRQQAQLLAFIEAYDARHGICPSYDEMREGIGLASKSGVARLINGLVERGKLRRHRNRARALEIVTGHELAHIPTIDLRRELNRRMGLAA